MRGALVMLLAGCYAPAATDGARCGPGDTCPTGQTCDLVTDRCTSGPPVTPDAEEPPPIDGPLDPPPDAPAAGFVDLFSRPDGTAIGNGWIEKSPATFSVRDGEVVRIATTVSYRDNLVYRPASEDLRDVEASVRFRFSVLADGFPQIFVRAQAATITAPDRYDGYILYINGDAPGEAVLGRQRGTVFVVPLARIALSQAFTTTDQYRLRLRATGADPVQLGATIENVTGAPIAIGEATVMDASPSRLRDPGHVGFAGDEVTGYSYDEFRYDPL